MTSKEVLIKNHNIYCNKEHKDRDLPPKDDHIENDHVYCDWCPYYYECEESPCPDNIRNMNGMFSDSYTKEQAENILKNKE